MPEKDDSFGSTDKPKTYTTIIEDLQKQQE